MKTRSAHQLLSQCLAGVFNQALDMKDLPANDTEWQSMLQLSGTQLITPFLRWALQENALLQTLPTDVLDYLESFYSLNLDDNHRYEDQLAELIQTLNRIGVRPLLLKGAATLVSGLYPTPGERYIGDIDILIPPDKLAEILVVLGEIGYAPKTTDQPPITAEDFLKQRRNHHYPAVRSLAWPIWIDLHIHPVNLAVAECLTAEEMVQDATLFSWRGGECLLPSPTHFVMHNIIHSYFVNYRMEGNLRLRQLFEFVHVSRVYANQIDWTAIQQRFNSRRYYRNGLSYYVALANAYLGFQPPPEIPIGHWIQLRAKLHLMWIKSALAYYLLYLFYLIFRLKGYARNPRLLKKKLLTLSFYKSFYQSLRSFKTKMGTSI